MVPFVCKAFHDAAAVVLRRWQELGLPEKPKLHMLMHLSHGTPACNSASTPKLPTILAAHCGFLLGFLNSTACQDPLVWLPSLDCDLV